MIGKILKITAVVIFAMALIVSVSELMKPIPYFNIYTYIWLIGIGFVVSLLIYIIGKIIENKKTKSVD
ncbi:MAG: hypothetical protein IKC41_07360 [Clostridia bacterium]|nr:hypothetical protein [Clostridia bacterium]MBR2974008.1 hypothetical protein [Clostridia bacterium]